MELSLRPYVSAGVAVAGAGLIAVVPVGPPAVDMQTRAVHLASVEDAAADVLSAAAAPQEYPVSTLADVFTNAFANLESLGSEFTSDPTPILTAIMDNQVIYANDLATAAETAGTNLVNALQEFPSVLSNAMSELASGDVYDAELNISQFLTQAPLSVLHDLNNGVFEVSQSLAAHLANLLEPTAIARAEAVDADAVASNSVPQWYSEIVGAQLMAPHAAELAFAGVSQDILDATQDGNSTLAFSDLVNAPATIVDAYLNGYNLGDDGGGGLSANFVDAVPEALRADSSEGLLSEHGTVADVRDAMETIAHDISPLKAAEGPVADAAASPGADLHTLVGDVSSLLSPDTAVGELVTAFDPNAVADITLLLTADLTPNASGWVVDLLSAF
jgi:hypothetical protein